jgi:hypothetical protein
MAAGRDKKMGDPDRLEPKFLQLYAGAEINSVISVHIDHFGSYAVRRDGAASGSVGGRATADIPQLNTDESPGHRRRRVVRRC